MAPFKSIVWRRRAVADSGVEVEQAPENVPYVLLYFTVRAWAYVLAAVEGLPGNQMMPLC